MPLRYGEPFDDSAFEIITDVPVKSLITAPQDGFAIPAGRPLAIRGHAWSGHTPVSRVGISLDGGRSWQPADLKPAAGRFAWRRFTFTSADPPKGEIEIIAQATDESGNVQPMQCVPWNPRGYSNNMVHRVRGRIG
jgi:hypothetical protein